MSTVTNTLRTRNQLISNFDLSKFLLGFNSFAQPSPNVTASGADVVLVQAEVMGRVHATGLIIPLVAAAVDGSQIPVGLTIVDQTILDGDTDAVNLVNKVNPVLGLVPDARSRGRRTGNRVNLVNFVNCPIVRSNRRLRSSPQSWSRI